MAVEGWGNAPDAAFAVSEFGLLFFGILVESVGRIGHDGVDGIVWLLLDPIEAVAVNQRSFAERDGAAPVPHRHEFALVGRGVRLPNGVYATFFAYE